MKLSGSKRRGQHLDKNSNSGTPAKSGKKQRSRGKRFLRFIVIFLFVITALVAGVFALYKAGVKPPPVKEKPRTTPTGPVLPSPSASLNPGDPSAPPVVEDDLPIHTRDAKKYTFLLLGSDDGNGNTDVMMVATFDSEKYTLDVVNIPRDTMVNVSWGLKKANTLYSNSLYNKTGMESVISHVADIIGYEVDYYVIVDLKAFAALVNAVDGVDFEVPVNMNYEDPAQNLYIHFTKGMHHLNGADALKVVRFRSYNSADIGRIETQQKFLTSAAKQILAKKDAFKSPSKLAALADIFINYVDTDISLGGVIWFGQEMLKMDAENITFTTLPGDYGDSVYQGGSDVSYVTIFVNDWLEIINSKLNPYDRDITASDLSILTRSKNGSLYVTNGIYAGNSSWGSATKPSSTSSPASSSSPTPSTSPDTSSNNNPDPGTQPTGDPIIVSPPPDSSPGTTGDPGAPTETPIAIDPPTDAPISPPPETAPPVEPPPAEVPVVLE